MSLGGEYRLWYLEDLLELLGTAGVPSSAKLVVKATVVVTRINALYDQDDQKYWKAIDRETTYNLTDDLILKYEKRILSHPIGTQRTMLNACSMTVNSVST